MWLILVVPPLLIVHWSMCEADAPVWSVLVTHWSIRKADDPVDPKPIWRPLHALTLPLGIRVTFRLCDLVYGLSDPPKRLEMFKNIGNASRMVKIGPFGAKLGLNAIETMKNVRLGSS